MSLSVPTIHFLVELGVDNLSHKRSDLGIMY